VGPRQRLLAFDPVRAETVARLSNARSPERVAPLDIHAGGERGTTPTAPRTDALDRSADPDGEDAATMLECGRQRHEAGDPREAARLYERAAALSELSLAVTAWFNLGVAREDLGDHAGALQAYRAALELDPRCADAHYNAARLCELSGDQVGALRHLKAYSTCPSR
jgi:tetratricopeptide (TPR) repeat protein